MQIAWDAWDAKRTELDREVQRLLTAEISCEKAKAIVAKPRKISAPTLGLRIRDQATAEAHVGRVCTYITADGREYGRILRATASEIVLDRLSMTEGGAFIPHAVPVCPRSRNRVTYRRDIRCLAEAAASASASAPASAPAPAPAISPKALTLKLAEELAEAHRREIARLASVEAELAVLKAKAEAARLKRNEASRRSKAKGKAVAAVAAPVVAKDTKPLLDVFDFFPELVEEAVKVVEEDPIFVS
jgi:hypothetical protein